MEIVLIAALSKDYVIGKNGKIPWQIKEDARRFKELTKGSPVIMGRKTWESLPDKFKPLPERLNIVLTTDRDYQAQGANVVHGFENAVKKLRMHELVQDGIDNETVYVIGGERVYHIALPYANRLELTHVGTFIDGGDAYFPRMDLMDWEPWEMEYHKGNPDFVFRTYRRK